MAQREGGVSPAPSRSLAADPSPSRGHSACSPAKANSSRHHRAQAVTGVLMGFFVCALTHVDAGVVGKNAVAGESHIFLLPLFVERVPAALQQDALMEVTETQE